jgi:retinol dehydrogenase 12
MDNELTPKIIVVTGATSGIGLAAAEQLVRKGIFVIGIGRSAERCRAAEQHLRAIQPGAQAEYLVADLSIQSEVKAVAESIRATMQTHDRTGLDGLLNNAGTFSYWLAYTPEGHQLQWAVNHLAPFLLTHELLPLLQAAPTGRVVTVSSGSHYGARLDWNDLELRRRYNGLKAYEQSKLANVLFTLACNAKWGPQSTVRAFAADPGMVKTEIGFKGTPALVRWIWKGRRAAGISPEESAKGIVYLLTEPSLQHAADIYWMHGAPKKPSEYALDADIARRLWAASEQMCGIAKEGKP